MKTFTSITVALLSLTLFTACGDGDDEQGFVVSDQPLSGTVAGAPFEVRSGSATTPFEDGEYWVSLNSGALDAEADPCDPFASTDGPSILLRTDGTASDAPLSLSNNITFTYDGNQNDVATLGRLVIDGIEGGMLRGGLYATTGDHVVDGQFEVPVCD